jgi:soluble P-type ATPase
MKTAQTKTPKKLESMPEEELTTSKETEKKPEIKIEDIYVSGQKTTSEEEKAATGENEGVEAGAAGPKPPVIPESPQVPEVKESLENTADDKEEPAVEEYPEKKVQESNLEKEPELGAEIKTEDSSPESESEPKVEAQTQASDKEEEVSVEKRDEEPEKEESLGEKKEPSDSVPDISLDAPLKSESAEKNEEDEPPIEKKNKKIFIIGIIAAGILVLLTAAIGFYYLSSQNKEQEVTPEIVEDVEEESEVAAAELVREDWKIEILNGSGIAGAAAKLQSALEDLGYEVVNVDNAPEDEEITRLFVNEKIVEQAELFVEDIKDIVEISGIVKEFEDSTATARIIIGEE